MKKKLAIALLGVTAFAAMPLFAHADVLADTGDTPAGHFYVTDAPGVWQETNNCADLQTSAGHSDACGDYAADTAIV